MKPYVSAYIEASRQRALQRATYAKKGKSGKKKKSRSREREEWNSDFKPQRYFDPSIRKKELFRIEPKRRESPRKQFSEDMPPLSPDSVTSSDLFEDYEIPSLPAPPLRHVEFTPPAPPQHEKGIQEEGKEKER